mmetsp:Transcript_20086/g.62128  ORF Transcript_20086/g.62128 Transcript_20086/m.62128 type:complete len:234 (-) Transcript_20086:682-1383(-)
MLPTQATPTPTFPETATSSSPAAITSNHSTSCPGLKRAVVKLSKMAGIGRITSPRDRRPRSFAWRSSGNCWKTGTSSSSRARDTPPRTSSSRRPFRTSSEPRRLDFIATNVLDDPSKDTDDGVDYGPSPLNLSGLDAQQRLVNERQKAAAHARHTRSKEAQATKSTNASRRESPPTQAHRCFTDSTQGDSCGPRRPQRPRVRGRLGRLRNKKSSSRGKHAMGGHVKSLCATTT